MDQLIFDEAALSFTNNWVKKNCGDWNCKIPPYSLCEYELIAQPTTGEFPPEIHVATIRLMSVPVASPGSSEPIEPKEAFWEFKIFAEYGKRTFTAIVYYCIENAQVVYSFYDRTGAELPKNQDTDLLVALARWNHTNMLFLASFTPELREYTEKRVKHARKKTNGKTQKTTYTRIALWRYVDDLKSGAKRLPPRKCDYRFGVRGHYRHYKSGKIVFVKAYEKNKDKPQRKDTCYTFPKTVSQP